MRARADVRYWGWFGALALAVLLVGGCNATPINVPFNKDGGNGQRDTFGPNFDAAVGGDSAGDAPVVPQGDVSAGADAAANDGDAGDAGDGGADADGAGSDLDAGPAPDGDAGASPDADAGAGEGNVPAVDTVQAVEAGGTGG